MERCVDLSLKFELMQWIDSKTILATGYTQFAQELALVMQTTHAQRRQYPDVSTRVSFLPLKMYTGITQILEFEYKTCMF